MRYTNRHFTYLLTYLRGQGYDSHKNELCAILSAILYSSLYAVLCLATRCTYKAM